MNRRNVPIAALALLLGILSGFTRESEKNQGPQFGTNPSSPGVPVYRFAVHPLHNPAKLIQSYQPLIDYLNRGLQGARLELEASRDYAKFEEKYRAHKPEFLLPNPWQTLQAMKAGYHVIAMAGEPKDFTGIQFAILADQGGRVLAATDKSKLGLYLVDLPKQANQTMLSGTASLVDVATPAVIGGHHVGWARIGIGQKVASEKLAQITKSGVIYALAALLNCGRSAIATSSIVQRGLSLSEGRDSNGV